MTDHHCLLPHHVRYSAIRAQLSPPVAFYGPPHITDFRVVARDVPDELIQRVLPEDRPLWRVYHVPDHPSLKESDCAQLTAAASGCVRVGVMSLGPNTVGIFGNIPMANEDRDETLRNAEDLVRLFTPSGDRSSSLSSSSSSSSSKNPPVDELGELVLRVLKQEGDRAHWTRKQETDTVYTAMDGRVLFVGDSAGAIYPSLGQGANLALEDAAVAGALFPDVATVASLRSRRREFIKAASRRHAEHVCGRQPQKYLEREARDWSSPQSFWRSVILPRLWCGRQLALSAVTATPDNFAAFGQIVGESDDGDDYSVLTDAVLDLGGADVTATATATATEEESGEPVSVPVPRLYYMKLNGPRPLMADRVTRHTRVTQCLGALSSSEDFYLVVHAPCDRPTLDGLRAFRIPPRHFCKLEKGTWHAGPLWTGPPHDRTYVNLELADTNVVDHEDFHFKDMIGTGGGGNDGDDNGHAAVHAAVAEGYPPILAEAANQPISIPIYPVPPS